MPTTQSIEIEVFRAGTHTDAHGRVSSYTEDDLVAIATKYNEQEDHEAPIVIGHPKDNAPAYGWVERLRATGDRLFATLKDCADEFMEWWEAGRYKKRSISLYSDGTLRHVGFLGAAPPAIKGLEDYQFSEPEELCFEFSDYRVGRLVNIMRRFRDHLIATSSIDEADKVISQDDLEWMSTEPYDELQYVNQRLAKLEGILEVLAPNANTSLYTETMADKNKTPDEGGVDYAEQLQAKETENVALRERVAELEKNQLPADFAEQQAASNARITELEGKLQTADFNEFLNSEDVRKRVSPANRPGVLNTMRSMAKLPGNEFEYTEGAETKKGSALEQYKAQILSWPVRLEYRETATEENAASNEEGDGKTKGGFELRKRDTVDPESSKRHQKVLAYAEANKVSYTEALDHVIAEEG